MSVSSSLPLTGERAIPGQFNLYEHERIYRLVISRYGHPEWRVLDYGCGSGYGAALLSRHFESVTGIDVSADSINDCRRLFPSSNLHFGVLDASRQPFDDGSFDGVFSFQVLEHVPPQDVAVYIERLWRMTRAGGVLVITTPNANNYRNGFSGNPFHRKEYTLPELEDLFRRAIPTRRAAVMAVADVWSTALHLVLRKRLGEGWVTRVIGKMLVRPLKELERRGIVGQKLGGILKTRDPGDVVGSFYIEITK